MRAVVGIGAEHLEDFDVFGPTASEQVAQAEFVIAVAGEAHDLKTGEDIAIYYLDDIDSVLVECLERIKTAWEEAKPEQIQLGHAAAGFWLFYWVASDLTSIRTLVREMRIPELRAAAADYIDSGFAADRGPTLEVTV